MRISFPISNIKTNDGAMTASRWANNQVRGLIQKKLVDQGWESDIFPLIQDIHIQLVRVFNWNDFNVVVDSYVERPGKKGEWRVITPHEAADFKPTRIRIVPIVKESPKGKPLESLPEGAQLYNLGGT